MAESEPRVVTTYEAISIAQNGNKELLSPCGGCEMNPDSCRIELIKGEQERALSSESGAALCLKFRQIIILDGGSSKEKEA